jgi:hypothetical protein
MKSWQHYVLHVLRVMAVFVWGAGLGCALSQENGTPWKWPISAVSVIMAIILATSGPCADHGPTDATTESTSMENQ